MKLRCVGCAIFAFISLHTYAETPTVHQPGIPFIADVHDVLKHPTPEYPRALRARHISGAGVFEVTVDPPSGPGH
jgi:hypothetical protein